MNGFSQTAAFLPFIIAKTGEDFVNMREINNVRIANAWRKPPR